MLQITFHNRLQKNLKIFAISLFAVFLYFRKSLREQNGVVRKLTVSCDGHPRDCVSVFGTNNYFIASTKKPGWFRNPPNLPFSGYKSFLMGGKLVGSSSIGALPHPQPRFITSVTELN